MDKKAITPYLPTAALLILCTIVPEGYFGEGLPWYGALTYHFTHANVFHLLSNFVVTARFRPRWGSLPWAYLSATVAAYCPFLGHSLPTCGMSALVFALLARRDAILGICNWKLLLLNFAFALIPTYNWKIHLLSYLISFTIWYIKKARQA